MTPVFCFANANHDLGLSNFKEDSQFRGLLTKLSILSSISWGQLKGMNKIKGYEYLPINVFTKPSISKHFKSLEQQKVLERVQIFHSLLK